MMQADRLRRLVLVCAGALLISTPLAAQTQPAEIVRIQVDPGAAIGRVSPDFIGFGFETSAVAQSNYFSPLNITMIQLYRNLGPGGLMRIGGIISDHTRYVADGKPAARTQNGTTLINRTNLANLSGFARAVKWKVMWGLNLETGSKDAAVEEAMAVSAALGTNLQSFEIGNEVEALRRFSNSFEAYHAAYLDYKSAIRAVLPNAPFSGPDSIGHLDWITNFAVTEARDIKLLTQHYYRGGAGDPKSTLERLLQNDDGWEKRIGKLREISAEYRVPFRINEVNSFSGGGKPGVSDTFGSALWCLDFMFRLASYGCDGVNMETDVNQLGFISHYSPIVHDAEGGCIARPEYYAMLAFATAARGEILKLALNKSDINLSAYATRDDEGNLWITIVNKDFSRDATVEAAMPQGYSSARAYRLDAHSMESKDHATLAGSEVSSHGAFIPRPPEKVDVENHIARVSVPSASAVLLRISGGGEPAKN